MVWWGVVVCEVTSSGGKGCKVALQVRRYTIDGSCAAKINDNPAPPPKLFLVYQRNIK